MRSGSLEARHMSMTTKFVIPAMIAAALSILVSLLLQGRLTPQMFAISYLIVMAAAVVIWTLLLKRLATTQDVRVQTSTAGIRTGSGKKPLQVSLLFIFLVGMMWMTRGGPAVPRLVGASFLLLFISGIALRKS